MTTSPARISKTTEMLIRDLRTIQNDKYATDEYKAGFRQAVVFALMHDTLWTFAQSRAYIDKLTA